MPSPKSATCSAKLKLQRNSKFRLSLGKLMRVCGHSMAPLLQPGELVFVRGGEFESRPPQRGDVVAVRPASLGGTAFVKRVVGLPHERVSVGERVWQLEEDEFFLLGDQPDHSLDSRIFGPVTREELIGRVRARVWPWRRFRTSTAQGGA